MCSVRRQLLEDPNVLFGGYRVPHPLEPAIQIKVQTRIDGPNPAQESSRPSCCHPVVCVQPYLAGPLELARPLLTALRRSPRAQAFHSSLDSLLAELNTFEERFKVFPRLPLPRPPALSR